MRLLLDTHALIWFSNANQALSPTARSAIEDPDNDVIVSAVNALEISIKHRLGKLQQVEPFVMDFDGVVSGRGFEVLSISANHARVAGTLPGAHGDPFDRILAAQALLEGLTIVSRDAALDVFGVTRLW